MKAKTTKFLDENRRMSHDARGDQDLLNRAPKALTTIEEFIHALDYMAVHISDKEAIAKTHKEPCNLKREKQLNKKQAKALNRYFIKEDAQMANKHIKSCLASSVVGNARIKAQ